MPLQRIAAAQAVIAGERERVFDDRDRIVRDRELDDAGFGRAQQHAIVEIAGETVDQTRIDGQPRFDAQRVALARALVRDASFPFENFQELAEAGLLALTVPNAARWSAQTLQVCARAACAPAIRPANTDIATARLLIPLISSLLSFPAHIDRRARRRCPSGWPPCR